MVTLHTPDDLFQRSSMSFGEHLEQLRLTLMKACLWLAAGTAIGLYFSEPVVQWMSEPFRTQLRQYHLDRLSRAFKSAVGTEPRGDLMALLHKRHLIPREGFVLECEPLNRSLDFSTAAELPREDWLETLTAERSITLKRQVRLEPIADNLNSFGLFEGFFIYLQASLIVGVAIALPGMFWHLWSFIAAGLYPHERRKVYQLLPLSVVLFIAGAALAYFVMIDLLVKVMLQYNVSLGVEIQPRLKDCFSLAMWLPLLFGLCFQLPLAMMILATLQLVTAQHFLAHQKIALLAITLISMILTPADPYTFIGLLIPLTILYYVGIVLCRASSAGNERVWSHLS